MGFFKKSSKDPDSVDVESLQASLEEHRARTQSLIHVCKSLLFFLKDFPLDISEIETDGFRKILDDVSAHVEQEQPGAVIEAVFGAAKLPIARFIEKEKAYLLEKEKELKNIIELLRSALTDFMGETQTFNSRIYEQNVRMEAITQLDDIRKIKESLQTEVANMKRTIQEKQETDSKRIETLSREVVSLKSNLEEAQAAASLDALTGAYNRLSFDTKIQWCIEKNAVIREPLSLLMCDLDDFKKINDSYGHITGDRVLKGFVLECKGFFRNNDFIARFGGEEFAILLPGMPLKKALKRGKELCNSLASKQYLIDASKPDQKLAFTVSIGVSELKKDDTVASFIDRADKALYRAKRSGKNQAVSEKDM
ncbi:GGDEF domain-containing protein [Desulfatirhabdium butyrativorans]|uniref:GGDEF domain-containing protein n=1 Tax=Desulfatirhabdium butyrativorans TaxID=340467 RepID=UPI0004034190|nr:GGDEF domain-containing protein [Desulfatirhabdium butyrativorans]